MKRTPIARRRTPLTGSSLLRRSSLRAVSRKRATELGTYSKLRRGFLETRPVCEFPDCHDAATEVHHKRGRVGLLLVVEYWAALCHDHHAYLTEHPAHAYELGLSERRVGGAA